MEDLKNKQTKLYQLLAPKSPKPRNELASLQHLPQLWVQQYDDVVIQQKKYNLSKQFRLVIQQQTNQIIKNGYYYYYSDFNSKNKIYLNKNNEFSNTIKNTIYYTEDDIINQTKSLNSENSSIVPTKASVSKTIEMTNRLLDFVRFVYK